MAMMHKIFHTEKDTKSSKDCAHVMVNPIDENENNCVICDGDNNFGFTSGRERVDIVFIVRQKLEKDNKTPSSTSVHLYISQSRFCLCGYDRWPVDWSVCSSRWFQTMLPLTPTLLSLFLEVVMLLSVLDQTLAQTDTFSTNIRYADNTTLRFYDTTDILKRWGSTKKAKCSMQKTRHDDI